MNKQIISLAFSCLLASCANYNETIITKKTISNFEILDCYSTANNNNYLVYEKDDKIETMKLSDTQLDSIKSMQLFNIEVTEKNGERYATAVSNQNVDTSSKKLFYVEAQEIEDYKRKSTGSYTLIESDGIIPVITPAQEISQMLRVESFKFYYYRNWDGKFYFDHIEENNLSDSE